MGVPPLVQNRALRLITGCHNASAVDHLHSETNMLPVGDHLELLSAQYLASAKHPYHPSHEIVNLPPGPRRMKETLKTKVGHLVEPHLVNGVIPAGSYKSTIDKIHSKVVQEATSKSSNNRVLDAPAPKIDSTESSLSLSSDSSCAGTAPFGSLREAWGFSTSHWQSRK